MLNKIVIVSGVLLLSACSGTTNTAALQTACTVDAIAVPLAEVGATAATVTQPGAEVANQAAQAADAPVHALIQKDCANLVPTTTP